MTGGLRGVPASGSQLHETSRAMASRWVSALKHLGRETMPVASGWRRCRDIRFVARLGMPLASRKAFGHLTFLILPTSTLRLAHRHPIALTLLLHAMGAEHAFRSTLPPPSETPKFNVLSL